jgi:putative transcription factor
MLLQKDGSALAITCEVCGNPIRGQPSRVEIDGAVLLVCINCAKRGTPIGAPPAVKGAAPPHMPADEGMNPDLEVDPDYPAIVKTAREKMGLTQEQLGRKINVKPSVISHVETGKMKPDLTLARTLMHQLKVNLLVASSELDRVKG